LKIPWHSSVPQILEVQLERIIDGFNIPTVIASILANVKLGKLRAVSLSEDIMACKAYRIIDEHEAEKWKL
jgi:hypothetical protein